ncbi:MAG: Transcription factor WhiB-like protein [Jatrophihabitans sp.]|nr:Transcription factor WhiB-like protein [Jatrophihabitans sp.]MCW2658630.1 Transcription factor WhiB-like protein [Jatrophihabitans sp.]MDT4903033.1 WhiB family transcriptional regulator, redox-sensing transcriptional regulator [Pseudonocardiales bacterium]MDT4930256.1 WhiB family transcriptional regulator, redox-sensing transcriptional regulator [Pseudonocardiales bacterium]MDT4947851.1 WhiB family transcriptional regulator, redox-sensing transcriptional regulator [Pseudonocardiales bacteriu
MLTSCPTDDLSVLDQICIDPIGLEPLDPLSKECPDDLPCRVENPELWFAETPADLERAKSFCHDCPARLACLSGALDRREPWGVWGGEIFERGAIVARKRPRGRPRKTERTEVAA